MKALSRTVFFALVLVALSSCSSTSRRETSAQHVSGAEQTTHAQHASAQAVATETLPLFEGLGAYHHPITTASAEAQSYFNQGLMLSYAFNHAQAKRSFLEGAKRDPQCAMCYWGAALVLGPNINAPMTAEAESEAHGYLQKAQALMAHASRQEQSYIQALAARYAEPAGADREKRDQAYAQRMVALAAAADKNISATPTDEKAQASPAASTTVSATVAATGPIAATDSIVADADIATLAAEALMDQHPWNYWKKNGQAQPWTQQIVTLLEKNLKRFPDHAGSHHLYIHAMEASPFPQKAVASADRLQTLVPAAGHLVHMPGHIYIRVGRYQDAIDSNLAAIEADKRQVAQSPGIYTMMYKPHNHHFLWAAATLAGQGDLAKTAAQSVSTHFQSHAMPDDSAMSMMRQHYEQTPIFDAVRFGRWNEILDRPMPKASDQLATAIQRYARAVAFAKTGRAAEADKEIAELESIRNRPELQDVTFMNNKVASILEIASRVATAERASSQGDFKTAIATLEKARTLEDGLVYNEPADWHHPIRQILGRVYLEAKQPKLAERAYLEDLRTYPRNIWSTTGLMKAYEAQGQEQKALKLRQQVGTLTLPASSF